MEGTSGIILSTEDPRIVTKRIYTKARKHRRTRSHRADGQFQLQTWAYNVTCDCETLFVPKAWDLAENEYKMYRIDTSDPINLRDMNDYEKLKRDLEKLYKKGKEDGIYPMDFELYRQKDGRVALIDFDKFGSWNEDGSVQFPWGLHWTQEEVTRFTPINQ